ncbi:MAG: RNA polymerase sigma factor, partial [Flavobacteriales bacterium]
KKEDIYLTVLDKHKGIIYKVANMYCHNKDDKDDLIQEIVLQLWLTLENFNDKFKWSTWVYRVALNTSISFYRKNKRRNENTVRFNPIMEVPAITEESDEDDKFLRLKTYIRELKEIDRALILLYLEGLNSKEIAEVIETTQTNVTTKISRIKKVLKSKFDNHKRKEHGTH